MLVACCARRSAHMHIQFPCTCVTHALHVCALRACMLVATCRSLQRHQSTAGVGQASSKGPATRVQYDRHVDVDVDMDALMPPAVVAE